jgi:hypothetical protein
MWRIGWCRPHNNPENSNDWSSVHDSIIGNTTITAGGTHAITQTTQKNKDET